MKPKGSMAEKAYTLKQRRKKQIQDGLGQDRGMEGDGGDRAGTARRRRETCREGGHAYLSDGRQGG